MDDQKLKEVTDAIRGKGYDGEMSLLTAGGVEIIVRTPDRVRFNRFRDMLMEKKKRPAAFESLVKSCMLYPAPAEYDALVDKRPAITMKLADKLSKMAGAGVKVEEKKL